jgi:hypothetical protein
MLAEIEEALTRGAVLLHPGDCLFGGQLAAMRQRFIVGDVDSVLPEQAAVGARRDLLDSRISETLLVLGPATRPLFAELLSAPADGEDLIQTLLHSDCRLAVCEQSEPWQYSNTTESLLAANRRMLDAIPSPSVNGIGQENELHGRVRISEGAFVSNCVIHGPVAIDDRAVVEDSYIGPYTAIGAGVILSGTEIDNSMVLAGAEIRHPGFRIEASIIGERSQITRSFQLPKGLHLRLGPDSQMLLS